MKPSRTIVRLDGIELDDPRLKDLLALIDKYFPPSKTESTYLEQIDSRKKVGGA